MLYKIIIFLYFMYSLVYTISFLIHEFKNKKYLSFFGTMLLIVSITASFFGVI